MSVENPKKKPSILSGAETDRVLEYAEKHPEEFEDLRKLKTTQAESQKLTRYIKIENVPQSSLKDTRHMGIIQNGIIIRGSIIKKGSIEKVLEVLDEFGELNTTQIKMKTGLSWTSVTRTLRIFKNRNIVNVNSRKDRMNNEKIYSLKRDRATYYIWKLQFFKYPLIDKETKKHINYSKFIEKRFPEGWETWEINLPKEAQTAYKINKPRVKIGDLPYGVANELLITYSAGFFCQDCFEKGNVSQLQRIDDVSVCRLCGREYPFLEETKGVESTKGRIWDVDKQVHKIKKKHQELKTKI
ncbi:MAG: hypothetical protein QXN55_08265 [Candidatus Nitrosotenuis sp.]